MPGEDGVVSQALKEVVECGGGVFCHEEVHNPASQRGFVDIPQGLKALHGLVEVHGEVEKLGVARRHG